MRKIRKKFKNPRMSWDSDEIADRKAIIRDYGLRRRREILIAQEILRNFRRRARELIAEEDETKRAALLGKLVKIGLLKKDQGLDDVLALSISDVLDRRLQTVVWKRGLASTARQARQFITHCHVTVSGRRVKSPAYMVPTELESEIKVDSVAASAFAPSKKAPTTADAASAPAGTPTDTPAEAPAASTEASNDEGDA